jgi:hypothetical protein
MLRLKDRNDKQECAIDLKHCGLVMSARTQFMHEQERALALKEMSMRGLVMVCTCSIYAQAKTCPSFKRNVDAWAAIKCTCSVCAKMYAPVCHASTPSAFMCSEAFCLP